MVRQPLKVFNFLALWMIGFGIITGIFFPFFAIFIGLPSDLALTKMFFLASITAGVLVGTVNIFLTRIIVGNRLRILAGDIKFIENNLREKEKNRDSKEFNLDTCLNVVAPEDEIGEIGSSLNYLVDALVLSHRNDTTVRLFTEILVSKLELDVLAKESLEQLLHYTNATAGTILVTEDGEIKIAASKGMKAPESIIHSEHVQSALQTEKRIIVESPKDIIIEGLMTNLYPQEVLIDPVLFNGVLQGIIILANSIRFNDEAKSRIDMFRPCLALAFNNALTHERMQHIAALDPLTGAYNRRFGMARLLEEFNKSLRMTYPLGLIMFDIDHFKNVNDTYGHLVGDQVLKEVIRRTLTVIRKGDIVIRYGGEEFLIIMPAASKKHSYDVGERLRQMVEKTSIKVDNKEIQLTISVGVSSFPEPNIENVQELIKSADDALYSAKNSGRNKVVGS